MNRPAMGRAPLASLAHCLLLALFPALLLVSSLSACTQESSDPTTPAAEGDSSGAASLTGAPVATRTTVHRVYGRLSAPRRKAVRRQVTAVIDAWWESAYLGGRYPRARFGATFPGFTRGAEVRAHRDRRLMSNADIARRVDSVTARRRTLRLDVLAVDRVARSVTARFVLRFKTTGEKTGTTVVRGRLFLTRRNGPWQVFGYDVAKGARA